MNKPALFKKKSSRLVGRHLVNVNLEGTLKSIAKQQIFCHFTSSQSSVEFFARIKHVNQAQGILELEIVHSDSQSAIHALPGQYQVTCVLQGAVYHFDVTLAKIESNQCDFFVCTIPLQIHVLQRRELYRINIDNLSATVENEGQQSLQGILASLCVSGCKVVMPACVPDFEERFMSDPIRLCLFLPADDKLTLAIRVKQFENDSYLNQFSMWVDFKNNTPPIQNRINEFMIESMRVAIA